MVLVNVNRAIRNPRFQQKFTILRDSDGKWVNGNWESTQQPLVFTGVVTGTNTRDLEMLPEGDRISQIRTFYSKQAFIVTGNGQISDKIQFKGDTYKLIKLNDYLEYGYHKVIGVRLGGV